MVALGILIVLIGIVLVYLYRYARARYALRRAKKAPTDPEAAAGTATTTSPPLPSDIRMPTWGSTADLVTQRFAQYELLYEQPPHVQRGRGRDRAHSTSNRSSAEGGDDGDPCEFCGRHGHTLGPDGYERRVGRRSRAVVRAHEECGSDLELPKYTSHPTSSCPRLVADDVFPPPPTPPEEVYVHVPVHGEREGLDLTATVAAVIAADLERERAERAERERQRQERQERATRTEHTAAGRAEEDGRRDSSGSAENENESTDSHGTDASAPQPPPRARRWTFGSQKARPPKPKRRPPVDIGVTSFGLVPL